jgi:hypothetical protein
MVRSRTSDSGRSKHGPGLQRRKSSLHTGSICEESGWISRRCSFGWHGVAPTKRGSDGRRKDGQMQNSEKDQGALSEDMKAFHLESERVEGSVSTEETNESESKNEWNVESPTERFGYALLF